ncbi:GNAT family N-acetyltransferase [Bacillus dakarensis]|uniref:GNAT family N-acetyltransferase n=1 Tax=Robertmurraya dakarensis TaxID=1926278 RepID=UPI00192A1BF9|nr:GNAT family N-acetyltransferase [Bacillus dakarensis]
MEEIKAGTNEFFIEEDGKVIGKIEFTQEGKDQSGKDLISVHHTEVSEGYNGRGLARKLVNRVVEYAREENKLIIPVCTYVKKVVESSDEFQDIVAK